MLRLPVLTLHFLQICMDCNCCKPIPTYHWSPAGETFLTQLLMQRLCEAFALPVLLQPLKSREETPERSDEHLPAAGPKRLGGQRQHAGSFLPSMMKDCLARMLIMCPAHMKHGIVR